MELDGELTVGKSGSGASALKGLSDLTNASASAQSDSCHSPIDLNDYDLDDMVEINKLNTATRSTQVELVAKQGISASVHKGHRSSPKAREAALVDVAKTKLQEFSLFRNLPLPVYSTQMGPNGGYVSTVSVDGVTGYGSSPIMVDAEKLAAANLLIQQLPVQYKY
jgi:hypothetical protein